VLKEVAKKSKTAIIAHKIYENWRMKRQFSSGNFESLHGSTHSTIIKNLGESIDYINVQFYDYLKYSGLTREQLRGLKIFELGFGDNVGVALKFIAAGASRVVCLDKFYSKRDLEQQRQIYLALRDAVAKDEQARFDAAINLSSGVEINPDKIVCIYGKDVEDATELAQLGPFDLVISRGAIQDIFDPDAAFEAMDRILVPGGYMLHKIDLSDQGMFRANGMNPLTYLTISDSVYRLMAVDSGRPNRKLRSYYIDVMERLGYQSQCLVTDIIGVGVPGTGNLHPHKEKIQLNVDYPNATLDLVNEVRSRLSTPFRDMSDEELIIDGIFIIAKKPA
jgi:Methyltransferase domain